METGNRKQTVFATLVSGGLCTVKVRSEWTLAFLETRKAAEAAFWCHFAANACTRTTRRTYLRPWNNNLAVCLTGVSHVSTAHSELAPCVRQIYSVPYFIDL